MSQTHQDQGRPVNPLSDIGSLFDVVDLADRLFAYKMRNPQDSRIDMLAKEALEEAEAFYEVARARYFS